METRSMNQIDALSGQASRAMPPWLMRRVERTEAVPQSIEKPAAADVPARRISPRSKTERTRTVLSITRPDGSEVLSIYV